MKSTARIKCERRGKHHVKKDVSAWPPVLDESVANDHIFTHDEYAMKKANDERKFNAHIIGKKYGKDKIQREGRASR
jgi:hypothetical protein